MHTIASSSRIETEQASAVSSRSRSRWSPARSARSSPDHCRYPSSRVLGVSANRPARARTYPRLQRVSRMRYVAARPSRSSPATSAAVRPGPGLPSAPMTARPRASEWTMSSSSDRPSRGSSLAGTVPRAGAVATDRATGVPLTALNCAAPDRVTGYQRKRAMPARTPRAADVDGRLGRGEAMTRGRPPRLVCVQRPPLSTDERRCARDGPRSPTNDTAGTGPMRRQARR